MSRVAIISYHSLPGIPLGFHQVGNCDIFTADYAKVRNTETYMMAVKNGLLKALHVEVMKHIDEYSKIYIYVGSFPGSDVREGTWHLFEILNEYHYTRGIKTIIVGCKCSSGWKQHLVNYSSNRITWEETKCDPQNELLAIIARENEQVVV